jgi:hypothetical protein
MPRQSLLSAAGQCGQDTLSSFQGVGWPGQHLIIRVSDKNTGFQQVPMYGNYHSCGMPGGDLEAFASR